MPNKWIDALKEHNKGSNKWCVPKKGTPEYDSIIKTMNKPKEYYQMPKTEVEKLQPITRKPITKADKIRDTQKWYDEGRKGLAPWNSGQSDAYGKVLRANMTTKDKKHIKDKHKAFDKEYEAKEKARDEWEKKNPILAKKKLDSIDRIALSLKKKKTKLIR